ncbi:PKD domain-containing protein [Haloferax marisrubri]|uniref:PKD domain-containing protein n=1 Tax=Haloferax marisrubri TaxID=1544719 RepID=UPI001E29C46F|nr:PKD domain-containing protein [Haloferax marisrubri]
MVITLLVVSLGVGVTAFSGVAAADIPDTSQCSAVSWTNQTISGQTYYEVDTLDKLQCIDDKGLGNNYVLTRDINASETSTWDSNNGFDPIGDRNNEFTGTFDGDDHTISGLTINRGGTYSVGLFSEVASGGTITNIGLEGGSVTGARRTGQLAGYNDGTVENSHVTGEVTGTYRVGGLVGRNDGTVRRSYAIGEPTRGSDWFGGLVGFNQGTVNRSFAARAVDGGGGSTSAGGLVGVSTGTIADSYATGTVTASWYAGGVLGSFQADPGGTVQRSYATGALSIDDETQGIGGLVGGSAVEPTTVEQAYWDVGTTNEDSVSTGDGWEPITFTDVSGFGATADTDPAPEMQGASAEANMSGLDFTGTWETVESEDTDAAADGYPVLRSLDRGDQLRAQGIAKPVVESVTRNSPTNRVTTSENVTFTVTFSEPVSGVDASDFTLTRTDSTPTENADSDVSVAGSDVRYVVSVTNISTDGTLRLDLVDDDSITDSDGNRLVEGGESGSADGSYTTGETYVIDTGAPVAMPTSNPNPADQDSPVSFDGSASTDTVDITSYLWDFGDGSPTATGPTPNHTYADPGTYTVTLNVSDVGGNTDTGTLNVTVQKVGGGGGATWGSSNDAPSANNDSYSVSAETRLDVTTESGLLANDSDPDDAVDSLSVSVVNNPMNGVLDLASDGSFTYTPTDGFTGRDSFTYEVSDEDGETDEATVTLTVQRTGDSERTILENASAIRQRFDVPVNATPTYAERVSLPTNQSGPVSVNFTQNTTVSRIQFGPDAEVRGNITVVEFATSESVPKALPGQSLVAFQLTGSPPAENASATVQLQLPRAAVRTAGATATAIRVAHHANGTWRLLNTTVVNQTNRTVTVEATTTGFSPFSVTLVGTPEATLSSMPTTVAVGEAFALDATGSSTPYGALVRYEWSVAGRQQSGETTTMVLDQPGTYPVELTVTNDAGQTANVTETVVVEAAEASGASTPTDVVTSENVQGAASDNSTETPLSTDVDSPGFGLVGSVVAILLTVIAVRRQ